MTSEKDYPGVERAYDFVIPSYQWMMARYDSVDAKLQNAIAFVATITTTVPALSSLAGHKLNFRSQLFVWAIVLATVAVLIGMAGRAFGGLHLVDISKLYDEWLGSDDWEFKKDSIHYAAENFKRNLRLVNLKGHLASVVTLLFLVEMALLLTWLTSTTSFWTP
jgi:hypothetical protein